MCVICYKRAGQKLPDEPTIRAMWRTNPDGAGVMWKTEAGIEFHKGFMKLEHLLEFVGRNRALFEGTEVAMHFRIGTHGGNTPGNTHPFVVHRDADPHSIMGVGSYVLMHNGILPVKPRRADISDTAELALRAGGYSEPDAFLRDADELLGTSNKVVLMRRNGDALFFGGEWQEGADGLKYSNLNHEFSVAHGGFGARVWGAWPGWEDEDYDPWADRLGQQVWTPPSKRRKKGKRAKEDEPLFCADDIQLPSYLDLGLCETEAIARNIVAEYAQMYAGTDFMTEQDWASFFETYRYDLEEDFWSDWEVRRLTDAPVEMAQ